MAKVILICGKVGSGKSYYANQLSKQLQAMILSVDEVALSILGQQLGAQHDAYISKIKAYLKQQSLYLLSLGVNVILDWGFWTHDEREAIKLFYISREISVEMHYIEVSDERWKRNIKKRNEAILRGDEKAYYCDDQLRELLGSKFEIPSSSEIDKWIK